MSKFSITSDGTTYNMRVKEAKLTGSENLAIEPPPQQKEQVIVGSFMIFRLILVH